MSIWKCIVRWIVLFTHRTSWNMIWGVNLSLLNVILLQAKKWFPPPVLFVTVEKVEQIRILIIVQSFFKSTWKINYMTKWCQRIRKVADTKSYPSTLIQKSIVFKLFHSGKRFQKVPFLWIFLCGYKRISVDGRRIRNNKVAFSNLSGIVWTGPKMDHISPVLAELYCSKSYTHLN